MVHKSERIQPNRTYFAYPTVITSEFRGLLDKQITLGVSKNTYMNMGRLESVETTNFTNEREKYAQETSYTYRPENYQDWIFDLVETEEKTSTNKSGSIRLKTNYTYDEYAQYKAIKSIERAESDNSLHLLTTYGYDVFGNVTSTAVSGWDGYADSTRTTTFQHSYQAGGSDLTPYSHAITTTTSPNGGITLSSTSIFNPLNGKIARTIDANNLTTRYAYDDFGREIEVSNPDGTIKVTAYGDALGGLDGPDGFIERFYGVRNRTPFIAKPSQSQTVDILGRPKTSAMTGFDGTLLTKQILYDEKGMKIEDQEFHLANHIIRKTQYEYDAIDRLIKETAYDDGVTTYQLDMDGGLWSYVTNAKNQTKKQKINAQGLISEIKEKNDAITLTYAYDANGSMTDLTDMDGNVINMEYDVLGRKTSMKDPDMGNWKYEYSAFSEMVKQTDAKDQAIQFEYDRTGRMTKKSLVKNAGLLMRAYYYVKEILTGDGAPAADENIWTYDSSPNGKGLLASMYGPDGFVKTIAYDEYSREQGVSTSTFGETYVINTDYDDGGRVKKTTYPQVSGSSRFSVFYDYNDSGYLERVIDADTISKPELFQKNYWKRLIMTPDLTNSYLGNGLFSEISYEKLTGRIASIQAMKPVMIGSNIIPTYPLNLQYTYDALGNVMTRADNYLLDPTRLVRSETFEYDDLNRLTSSKAVLSGIKRSFTYHNNGNVEYNPNHLLQSYKYGNRPHAVTEIPNVLDKYKYYYDVNGNMMREDYDPAIGKTKTYRSFEYNGYNMPVKVVDNNNNAMAAFAYNPEEELIRQEVTYNGTTTTTTFIEDLYEKVSTGSTTEHKLYIVAEGEAIAIHTVKSDKSSENYYILRDNLDSTVMLTDGNGDKVNEMSYRAFGLRRDPGTWCNNLSVSESLKLLTQKGFTGHNQLDVVGLIHMKARLYDPGIGRFISPDSIIPDPYNSQSLNRYSYCVNNPVSRIDPDGHWSMSGISKSLSNIGKSVMNSINKAIGAVKKAVQGTSGKDKIGGSTKDLTPNQQEISQKSGTPQNAPQPTVKSGGEQKKKKEEAQQSKTVKKPGGDIFAYSPKYPLFGPPPIMVKGKLVDDVGALKANKILTGVTGATSVDLTVSGGYKNLGGSFQISVSESGITYFGGIGWGLGLGVSLTTGYNIGNSSGLGANFAIAGGKKVGGTVSGTISTGGNSVNAGVGVGVGSGGSITIGYGGTLVSF